MKVLIIDSTLSQSTIEKGGDLLYELMKTPNDLNNLFEALIEKRAETHLDFFVARSYNTGLKIAEEKKFGINDIVFIDVFLLKNDVGKTGLLRCGEQCAAYLMTRLDTNVILLSNRILDNVVLNVQSIIKNELHKNLNERLTLKYVSKKYGTRIGDRSDLKYYINEIVIKHILYNPVIVV